MPGRPAQEALILEADPELFEDRISHVKASGGKILVKVSSGIAWVAFPNGFPADLAKDVLLQGPAAAEQVANTVVDATHTAVAGTFASSLENVTKPVGAPEMEPLIDDALEPPPISRRAFLENMKRLKLDESNPMVHRVAENLESNSGVMTGSVTVALVLIESDGSIDPDTYTWTDEDVAAAIAGVTSGLAWWARQAQDRGLDLSFHLLAIPPSDSRAQQGYEPIFHSGVEEQLWIRSVMTKMGYTGDPYAALTAFDTWLRLRYRTDRAYTAFVAYNPAPAPTHFTNGYSAWAYRGGPYTSFLFRSFEWSIERVFAHETGHIFGACDEYYQPGYGGCTSCGPCSHDIDNGNCQYCNPDSVPCMMRINDWAVCDFTALQVGWSVPEERQCLEIRNVGEQSLTISTIGRPSWLHVWPLPPLEIVGGASTQICANINCESCDDGRMDGALTIGSNDSDETPFIPIQVDCTCAVTHISCRCRQGWFNCSVLFPDLSRDGSTITIEVDGVPLVGQVVKNSARFNGPAGSGSHNAILVNPGCPNVTHDFSCQLP